jgi:pyruvate-ferredoxin/flavodoxin oxidoreductase
MLASNTPQEAHDLAAIAHAATLRSRVPFLHFFDGFRTSHEIGEVELVSEETLRQMLPEELIVEHRLRSLNPRRPVVRGTAQNPDVFFQAREAANPYHAAVPDLVAEEMDRFAGLTGRGYSPFEYVGAPDAERILVIMGSGAGAVRERGEEGGGGGRDRSGRSSCVSTVRSTPPASRLPSSESVRSIAVLDRDERAGERSVSRCIWTSWRRSPSGDAEIEVSGGRYGLSSKEFTPAMVRGVLADDATTGSISRSASSTTSPTRASSTTATLARTRPT